MIKEAIAKIVSGRDLEEEEMKSCMEEVIKGRATPAQIGAFVTALRLKGETVDEIVGAAKAMRSNCVRIFVEDHLLNIDRDEINVEEETILDTCGTGGDTTKTFNISTASAFVVAGAGLRVAKHGNRAVSSLCGSADVVEALGVKLDVTSSDVERCIREIGIGFLYAPIFHGAMRHAAGPRQEIGIRTIFNLLGPLTNPAGASVQVLGVYEPLLTEKIAHVLGRLGTRSAFVVCGEGTLDEISLCGSTRISRLINGEVRSFDFEPEEVGLERVLPEAIRGGDALENARIIRDILDGEVGPKRDIVLLNAAAAFMAAGLDSDLRSGIERARESIDSGRAKEKLQNLIRFTQGCTSFVRKDL